MDLGPRNPVIGRASHGMPAINVSMIHEAGGWKFDIPNNLTDLTTQGALASYNAVTRLGWRGPYVDNSQFTQFDQDAWAINFVYSSASRFIRSWGPNKTDNSGANDDITLNF